MLVGAGRLRLRHLAAVLFVLSTASAPARAEPGEELTISVLTFGPGDHPFFKFGHTAVWVQPRGQEGVVFNYGTFAFDNPNLIPKFLRGRLIYWLSVSPTEPVLYSYESTNRTIEVQELDLTPAERWTLFQYLRDNARPDKREYLYDYFWDNCTTRVRDAVDVVTRGRVREAGKAPATMTMRDHALRMTADLPWELVGLWFGLGSPTDARVNRWQEAFLPDMFRNLLRTVRIERDGVSRPLVKSERVLFQAQRPAKPAHPPRLVGWFLLVGLAVGGGLAALGRAARRRRAARVGLGLAGVLLGLVLGLLGVILVLLWIATNHKSTYANANIMQVAPWLLALVPLGIGTALGRAWAARGAFLVAASAAALSALGLVVKVLPGANQDNLLFIALLLPIWGGLAYAFSRLSQEG